MYKNIEKSRVRAAGRSRIRFKTNILHRTASLVELEAENAQSELGGTPAPLLRKKFSIPFPKFSSEANRKQFLVKASIHELQAKIVKDIQQKKNTKHFVYKVSKGKFGRRRNTLKCKKKSKKIPKNHFFL